jgi:SagB-type dehydrogenase family enzyme
MISPMAMVAAKARASPISIGASAMELDSQRIVQLPNPRLTGPLAVEQALLTRRSVREFGRNALALNEVAQVLWAAQGMTGSGAGNLRTAPSAGALYPLEVLLMAADVGDLPAGLYRYLAWAHALEAIASGDYRAALVKAASGQDWIAGAACVLALTAVYGRTTDKYGHRGERYVHMEVGHVAQNVYLQARALGLGTTIVGAFSDQAVQRVLHLQTDEAPLALLPLGRLP